MRIFDSIPKGIERLRLVKQLSAAMKAREQETNRLKKLSLLKQIREALTALGVTVGAAVVQAVARPVDTAIKFFPKEERRTPRARQKDNNAALALMDKILAEGRPATEEEKAVLARFSGYGGNLTAPDGSTGSPYEYYTPTPLAAGIWDAMAELGFKGGKAMDPSAGSGVFAATRPRGVAIDQVELSNLSGQINRLVNDDDTVSTKISAFEYIAASTPDESYDAVVTNVPFGGNDVRDRRARESDKWSSESLEYYFILRSLDKLKPGGIAAFIVPPRVVSDLDAKSKELRHEASMRAEFIGAHRLPTDVFLKYSEADTIADVIFFRKHSKEARQKFREIAAEDITVLATANVLWDEFVSGRYFNLSGKRFIHGEFKPKDPTKFRDVDRVINGPGLNDLRPLIAKLPKDSRIDWDLIGAQQPVAAVYRDGDVIYQDGRTLEMQNGEWVVRESDTYSFANEIAELTTPLNAVNKGTAWDAAGGTIGRAIERGQGENIPAWAMQAYRACEKVDPGARASVWLAACAAFAVVDVTARGTQQDYRAVHPELTKAVESGYRAMAKIPSSAAKELRDAVGKVKSHYSKRNGWSNFWKGDVLAEVQEKALSPRAAYNKLRYESGNDQGFVAIDKITEIRGDDFDPYSDDEWCVSPDGTGIIHADEYYQGNYARWLADEQANLDRATDPKVRAKIMRQIEAAKSRLDVPSVDSMSFDLRSPFISIETKRAFLVETLTNHVSIEYEADTGIPYLKYTLDANKRGEREKVIARLFASYLKTGNINTGTATQSGGEAIKIDKKAEKEFLGQIKDLVASQNAAFNLWVKSNRVAMDEVRDRFADPATVEFVAVEDDAEIEIDGIHPDFKPHSYQRQEIRRQGRKFGGINGFNVGLGKTSTALCAVQYAHNIGVKKKTMFVVPNTVLSNWRKEAIIGAGTKGQPGYRPPVLTNADQCLFVGLDVDKNGNAKVSSGNYARDVTRIMENRHRMIFITLEAFKSIPLREQTVEDYQWYMGEVDKSFEAKSDKKADRIRAENKKGKVADSGEKSGAMPFFEDLGIDSLVLDEAHTSKNSKFSGSYKGATGLPLSSPSDRGLDAQVKAWFVRNKSPSSDGVMCLTATPITNSPLEIYAMLSLSVGEQEINRRLGVRGAEEFLEAFCDIEHREEIDLIGNPREGRVFVGIKNTAMLSAAIRGIANIKDAADVGGAVELPEADEAKTRVDLGERDRSELMTLKRMYHIARQLDKGGMVSEDEIEWLSRQAARFPGESVTLLAHPFNLINKMANLILDRELFDGLTVYKIQPPQREAAQKVVDRFNDSKITEDRERPSRYTKPENVTFKSKKIKLSDDDNADDARVIAVVKPLAWIEGDEIKIDTISYKTQEKFLSMAEKAKLLLDVNLSAKMAAFIENFKREQANPKAAGKIAKQIVFADAMGSMHKIRLALVNHCGVPANKIAIINGQAVTDPADMQEIQDGFNADADSNAYSVIIANKKAEVGINLQKGTQAIHHLTIGWTPDSLTQRNGRGVRQGNYLRRVTVYHYDAGGTFDEYKRGTVNKKGDWIGAVMAGGNESGVVRVSGQMTEEEAHELIMAVGDEKAVEVARAAAAKREHRQEIASARNQQVQILRIIQSKLDWISRNDGAGNFRATKELQLKQLREAMQKAIDAYAKAQGTDKEERARVLMESAKARHAEMAAVWGVEGSHDARMAEFNAAHEKAKEAIDAAKVEFASLSKRKGAYAASTINALEDKNAVIVSGQVIENGMIAKVGDDYLIVRDKSRRGRYGSFTPETYHPPSRKSMELKAIEAGVMFFGPGDSDEDWGDAVRACVKIDEATVAASAEGFGTNDDSLYSTYIPAVRDALSVQIPSRNMAPDHVVLKAPYYATPIDPEIKFTAIGSAIVKEQSAITKWVTEKTYYRESRYVSISDLGLFGEGSRGDTAKNLIDWVIAHDYRLTAADAADLNDLPIGAYGRSDPMGTLITAYAGSVYDAGRADFDAMLSNVAAKAKVPSEIDEAVAAWFKQRLPLISPDLYEAHSVRVTAPVAKQVRKLKDQLATGGKTIVWAESLIPTYNPASVRSSIEPIIEAVMADDEAMEAIADAMDAASIGAIGRAPELHPAIAAAFAAKIDGQAAPVEGAKEVSELVRRMMTPRIKEESPYVLYQRNLVGHIEMGIKAAGSVLSHALLELKAAKASGGIDVAGLVAKARKLPGVDRVEVMTSQINRTRSPWSGAFVYEPGITVSVATRYKSDLSNQISSKESGLPGRYFDNKTKTWILTLKDDALDDKGAKVASLQDLIAFASAEVETA